MQNRNKTRLATLALFIGSLVVCGFIVEAIVLAVFGEQAKFPRHVVGAPFGVRINEPNSSYRHKSADVNIRFRINGQGMRAEHDYAYAKPEGVKRIVLMGDSYTVGYEVDFAGCYGSILEAELNRAGIRAEVLNTGVSGFGNAEEVVYLERELLKYQPDLVVVGFYGNDLVDNVRSELFRLDGDQLVAKESSYVPAGRLADFLNTNYFFNLLSERSNAFVLVKERATEVVKQDDVKANVAALDQAEKAKDSARNEDAYERRLAVALFERLNADAAQAGAQLAVVGIPTLKPNPDRLIDTFPAQDFPGGKPPFTYLSAKAILDPALGKQQLYWLRSHYHWTPFAHREVGVALAKRVIEQRLLD